MTGEAAWMDIWLHGDGYIVVWRNGVWQGSFTLNSPIGTRFDFAVGDSFKIEAIPLSSDTRFAGFSTSEFGSRTTTSPLMGTIVAVSGELHAFFEPTAPTPTPTPAPGQPTPSPGMPTPVPGGSPIPATNPFRRFYCSWLDANWHWYGIESPGSTIRMSLPSGLSVSESQASYVRPTNPPSGIDRCGRSSPIPTPVPATPVPEQRIDVRFTSSRSSVYLHEENRGIHTALPATIALSKNTDYQFDVLPTGDSDTPIMFTAIRMDSNGNLLCLNIDGNSSNCNRTTPPGMVINNTIKQIDLYPPTAAILDTWLCDSSIKDPRGLNTLRLFTGVMYAIRTYLYRPRIAGTGCDFPKDPLGGFDIEFLVDSTVIARQQTTVSGYTGVYWTPQITDAGAHNIRIRFKGLGAYKPAPDEVFPITVSLPVDKFTVRVTNPIVNGISTVRIFGATKIPGMDYYLTGVNLVSIKSSSGNYDMVFTEADGLIPGRKYFIAVNPLTTIISYVDIVPESALTTFSGLRLIPRSPQTAPPTAQYICDLLGITTDCSRWLSALTVDLLTPIADISVINWNRSLYTGEYEEPTWWNYLGLGLSVFPFVGGAVKVIGKASFMEKAVELITLAKQDLEVERIFEQMHLLRRIKGADASDMDTLISYVTTKDYTSLRAYLDTFEEMPLTLDERIGWENAIKVLMKEGSKVKEVASAAIQVSELSYISATKLKEFLKGTAAITRADIQALVTAGETIPHQVFETIDQLSAVEFREILYKLRSGDKISNVLADYLDSMRKVRKKLPEETTAYQLGEISKDLSTAASKALDDVDTTLFKETVSAAVDFPDSSAAKILTDVGQSPISFIEKSVDYAAKNPILTWRERLLYYIDAPWVISKIDLLRGYIGNTRSIGIGDIDGMLSKNTVYPYNIVAITDELTATELRDLLVKLRGSANKEHSILAEYIDSMNKIRKGVTADSDVISDAKLNNLNELSKGLALSAKAALSSADRDLFKDTVANAIELEERVRVVIPKMGESTVDTARTVTRHAARNAPGTWRAFVYVTLKGKIRSISNWVKTNPRKSIVGTSGATTFVIYWLAFELPGFNAAGERSRGVAPGQRTTNMRAKLDTLKTSAIAANEACENGDFVNLATLTDAFKTSLDDAILYKENNKEALESEGYLETANNSMSVYELNFAINSRCTSATCETRPVAAFSYSPGTANVGQIVQFTDASSPGTGQTIVGWVWNFGDGSPISTIQNPTHSYSSVGSKAVVLTVTNSCGETNTKQWNIDIEQPSTPWPTSTPPPPPTPIARFTMSPERPRTGQWVNFDASASTPGPGTTMSSYTWYANNVQFATGVTANKTFPRGSYIIKVKVTNSRGVSAHATEALTTDLDVVWLGRDIVNLMENASITTKDACDVITRPNPVTMEVAMEAYANAINTARAFATANTAALNAEGNLEILLASIAVFESDYGIKAACLPDKPTIPENGILSDALINDVTDGDTISASHGGKSFKVRLLGINTPERPSTATGGAKVDCTPEGSSVLDRANYTAANLRLTELLDGQRVTLRVNVQRPFDTYNRLLAVVIVGTTEANLEMLKAGLACYFHRQEWDLENDVVNHALYIQKKDEAKAARLGIWAPAPSPSPTPVPPRPTASFDYVPRDPKSGQTISFDASQSSAGSGAWITDYIWLVDNVEFARGIVAEEVFLTGSYMIKLKVINNLGANDTTTTPITVDPAPTPAPTPTPAPFSEIDEFTGSLVVSERLLSPEPAYILTTVAPLYGTHLTLTSRESEGFRFPDFSYYSPLKPLVYQNGRVFPWNMVRADAKLINNSSFPVYTRINLILISPSGRMYEFPQTTEILSVGESIDYGLEGYLPTDAENGVWIIRVIATTTPAPITCPNPTASFVITNTVAGQPVTISAAASSGGTGHSITSFYWDFGDGTTGTGERPTKTYPVAGNVIITLIVTNDCGKTDTVTKPVTISAAPTPTRTPTPTPCPKPTASFVITNTVAGQPVAISAAASSGGTGHSITSFDWDFGDGTTGTGERPTKTYPVAREVIITLIVTNDCGETDTVTKPVTIDAAPTPTPITCPNPAASFVITNTVAGQPVTISAAASSGGTGHSITSFDWDFGDGTTGTGERPTKTYPVAGNVIITLIVTNDCGKTDTVTKPVTISAAPTPAPDQATWGIGQAVSSSNIPLSSARIYVDGVYSNHYTPESFTLSSGEHTIEVTKSGYKGWVKTRTLIAGENVSDTPVMLREVSVTLIGVPESAEISVDDIRINLIQQLLTGLRRLNR